MQCLQDGTLIDAVTNANAAAVTASQSSPRTAQCVIFALYVSVGIEFLLMLWAAAAIPITQRPWASTLSGMPDAGLLLLVLTKLGVTSQPVHVLDLSAAEGHASHSTTENISHYLRILHTHGVIRLLTPDSDLAGVGDMTKVADVPTKVPILVVVDMDQRSTPPQSLATRSAGGVQYVAWSCTLGFRKIAECGWATMELSNSIVAKPETPEIMLETILCRVLSIALSGDARDGETECTLTAGGPFEVSFDRLQVTSTVADAPSPTGRRTLARLTRISTANKSASSSMSRLTSKLTA